MSGELWIKKIKEFWSVFTVSVEISVSCVSKTWQHLNESKSKIGVKGTWWAGFIVLQMRKWFHYSMFLTCSWSLWAGTEQGGQQRKFKGQKTQCQYCPSAWQRSSVQADGQSLDWSGQRAKPALRSIYGSPNVSTSTLLWLLICMTSGYFCIWSSDAFQQDLLVLKSLSTLKHHISLRSLIIVVL